MGRITEFFKVSGYNYGFFERILTPDLNLKTVTVTPLGNEQSESLNLVQELDKNAQNETMENLNQNVDFPDNTGSVKANWVF